MKLHQGSSNFSETEWSDALSTVSVPKTEGHAKDFRKYCSDNVYVSMIVTYPTKWTDKLSAPSELPKDANGVQQIVVNIGNNNFGGIFLWGYVEFIDRLKNALLTTMIATKRTFPKSRGAISLPFPLAT
jgi:hypothetical protein